MEILALDLDRVASLAGISTGALVSGLHHARGVRSMQGVMLDDPEAPPAVLAGPRPLATPSTTEVLISCASRPGPLDVQGTPKALIPVGAESILRLLLRQIAAAGLQRVVIVLGFGGAAIREDLRGSGLAAALTIEYVDLGHEYAAGFANSLLAGAAALTAGQPFVLATCDHVFDSSLLHRIADRPLGADAACVMVEQDVAKIHADSLAATAVRVICDQSSRHVVKMAQGLSHFDAIEAGLFLCGWRVFEALTELQERLGYFTLAQALADFAAEGSLAFESTDGAPWVAVETRAQLAQAEQEQGTNRVLSPFEVIVAPAQVHHAGRMMLAVSGSLGGVLDVASPLSSSLGFAVPATAMPSTPRQGPDEATWMLAPPAPSVAAAVAAEPLHGSVVAVETDHELDSMVDPFLLTFEPDHLAGAYLLKDDHGGTMLAVLDTEDEDDSGDESASDGGFPHPHHFHHPHLPSGITEISLETGEATVRVHIKQQVPAIGYVLLVTALVSVSTLGTATDLQGTETPETLKVVWRNIVAVLLQLPMALAFWPEHGVDIATFVSLMTAGSAYSIWLLSFNLALGSTSIAHAFLFNNLHSSVLIGWRLVRREPVTRAEAMGVSLGLVGCAMCAKDASVGVSAWGDFVAFAGSVAGACYLVSSKALRPRVDVFFLTWTVNMVSLVFALVAYLTSGATLTADLSVETGAFGWLASWRGFGMQLYISGVCSTIGLTAYLGVLKYVPAVVVSMAMLSEPVLANVSGVLTGVDRVPGVLTLLGGCVVMLGSGTVAYAARDSEKTVDASGALSSIAKGSATASPLSPRSPR